MAATLGHRGPDDAGVWVDAAAGIGIGHRRLSVLDPSPVGHQPMVSSCGRYVLSYNGELYNHLDLHSQLVAAGRTVDPSSDSRVLVEVCATWGVQAAIPRLRGMFALALWDRKRRLLHLVRDRIGIKPLYWGRAGDHLLFGSELKALRAYPAWAGSIDRASLSAYMRFAYVPAPRSIYENICKLEPGRLLTVDADGNEKNERYWSLRDVALRGRRSRRRRREPRVAVEDLDGLLRNVVKRHMISDVPLGAFLSGGIDSSAVVALMQAVSSAPVRTFSIGTSDPNYDESGFARDVARHLGTDHTELIVEPEHALAVIPRLPELYDEPFADPSQIPTFLISELTRRSVTVALSGDGGDELFLGYNRYHLSRKIGWMLEGFPKSLRQSVARACLGVPTERWDAILRNLPVAGGLARRAGVFGDRLHKLARVLEAGTVDELYLRLISQWDDPGRVVRSGNEPESLLLDSELPVDLPVPVERMAFLDGMTYLPDDILTKVDRASMAVGLEVRVPLLDHEVVELAWNMPLALKYRDGERKWLLKQLLYRYVPKTLMERPKMGFGVPLEAWLRGPLREWAEDLLAPDSMRAEGYLNPDPIRRRWDEHCSGARNWQTSLWAVLMFQQWLRSGSG